MSGMEHCFEGAAELRCHLVFAESLIHGTADAQIAFCRVGLPTAWHHDSGAAPANAEASHWLFTCPAKQAAKQQSLHSPNPGNLSCYVHPLNAAVSTQSAAWSFPPILPSLCMKVFHGKTKMYGTAKDRLAERRALLDGLKGAQTPCPEDFKVGL